MSENVVSSESGVKYAQIKHILQGSSKLVSVNFDMRGQQRIDFFIVVSVIMDYGLC